jgi:hypothetical protein
MTIKTDLQYFYDHEAKKYYETRKKFWKEGELILQAMKALEETSRKNKTNKEKIRILEF